MKSAEFLTVLSRHLGRDNGISAEALATRCGLANTRQVRKLVSALRFEGTPICGTPRTGYFIATTAADIAQFSEFHRARALHELAIVSRLENIPLPALAGQLALNQA